MPLILRKIAKSKNWYIRGSVRGLPVDESTGTEDREIADAIRIKKESELLNRSVFGARASVTFAEAANAYIGSGGKKGGALNNRAHIGVILEDGSATLILSVLGDAKVDAIKQADVDRAANQLYPGTKASTRVRHVYGPVKAVLTYAAEQDWCPLPMIRAPHVAEPVTKYSSAERMQKLLPFLNPALRLFVMVLMITGARLSEVLALDWDKDVSLSARTITFWKTKTKQREARITDHLLMELALVEEGARHGPMFHWEYKCSPHRAMRRACERAGVEYLPPHQQGRHTYAMWMLKYGKATLRELMEAGGWTSVQSVIRYLHAEAAEAGKKAEFFPDVLGESGENPGSTGQTLPLKSRIRKRKLA